MPNWCNNNIELAHKDPAMIERAAKAFADGTLLNEFIPLPKELEDTISPARETNEELIKKYGAADWYSWCISNWGTKWDISPYGCEIENGQLVGSFDSPWGPPTVAYEKLEEMGFSVRAYYNEPGMGFAGVYEDGFDESFDYSGMDADEAEDYLPEALDEMYCITENMREWEEENAEEGDN
jgi:hypothetical protein